MPHKDKLRRSESATQTRPTLEDMPFSRLIKEDPELAGLRQRYAGKPPEHRRQAALWEYEADLATDLFNAALDRQPSANGFRLPRGRGPCPGAVLALAIDPGCAPAMLTIGSIEHQLGRTQEAMDLFLALPGLKWDAADLHKIIDEAGDFLLGEEDYRNAKALYRLATERHPGVAPFHGGLCYAAAQLGEIDEALAHARRAVEIDPENHRHLNRLGWTLTLAGRHEEAEEVLEKAVAASPPGDALAKNNLAYLRRQRRQKPRGAKRCPSTRRRS